MLIEFEIHNLDLKDIEIKQYLTSIIKYNLDNISILPYYLKHAVKINQNSNTTISCPIDYPLGILDSKSREYEIQNAIKNGANKIDVVCPTMFLINRKYDKLREDIKKNLDICLSNNVEINYILEYRLFNYAFLSKIAEILYSMGIKKIYPSTGHMLDCIEDNIIACNYLNQKTPIKCISTADAWTKQHIKNLIKYKIYGIRFKKLNALKLFYDTDKSS